MDLDLAAERRLWTPQMIHATKPLARRKLTPKDNTAKSWAKLAMETADVLSGVRDRDASGRRLDPQELLDQVWKLLGDDALAIFRIDRMSWNEAKSLDNRVDELREAYEIDDLEQDHHRAVRALVLLAGEFSFLPIAEGALSAIRAWPATPRFDLRTVFHAWSRWWHRHERVLAALVAAALHPSDAPRPWPPMTRLLEIVLERQVHDDVVRAKAARELSAHAIQELFVGARRRSTPGAIVGRLLAQAEGLRVLERRPDFDIDPETRRLNELTWIALDLELEQEVGRDVRELLDLMVEHPTHEAVNDAP